MADPLNSLTPLKVRAIMRDLGHPIKVGPFESIARFIQTETQVSILVSRAQFKESRGNQTITKRGHEAIQLSLVPSTGEWKVTEHMTVWWSTDERHERG